MSGLNTPLEELAARGTRRQTLADCGLILLAAGVACFLFLGQGVEWQPREARHGVIAAEMAQSGDYFVPRLLGQLYEYKPPVLHAAAALLFNLCGGPSMFLLRLPLALAASASAIMFYFLGRILLNRDTALFAALALLGSVGFARWSHTARPDMIFAAALVGQSLGLAAGMAAATLRGALLCCFLSGVAGGLALLTKGPYGIYYVGLFALALILAAPWGRKDLRRPRLPGLAAFGLGFAILPLAWGLPIYLRGDTEYLHLLFSQYNPGAGIMHSKEWHYYLVHGLAGLLPWAVFLPLAVKDFKRQRALAVLVAGLFVVFSCIRSKEERYLLPWYPFAVLLLTAPLVRRFAVRWQRNASLVLLLLGLAGPPLHYGLLVPHQHAAQPRTQAFAALLHRLGLPVSEYPQGQAFAELAVKSVPAGSVIHSLCGFGETAGFMAYILRAPGEVMVTENLDRGELRAIAAARVAEGKLFFVVAPEGALEEVQRLLPEAPLQCSTKLRVQERAGHLAATFLLCRVPLDAATAAQILAQPKHSAPKAAVEPGDD
ncbi:MAG: glycosyltransferase family 39 protein [Planctomycetota bacterium]